MLRLGESATRTSWFVPLSWIAPPTSPLVQVGAPNRVPGLPWPLLSPATLPLPSSKVQYPTRPGAPPAAADATDTSTLPVALVAPPSLTVTERVTTRGPVTGSGVNTGVATVALFRLPAPAGTLQL